MKELQIFNNEQFVQVRVLNVNCKDYFVGSDIAKSLGYSIPSKAINTHCKGVSKMEVPTNGGKQEMLVITEGDVYRLISHSKLPAAEKFESWIFDDVLPQIRKTGGYIPIDEEESEQDILAKALLIAQNTLKKKDELLKSKDAELESKNRFLNQLASSENSLLVREVAKVASKENIVIGEKRLWAKLREWGLVFKNSTEPKQLGIDKGLFEVNEGTKEAKGKIFTYRTTRVTGKGQAYIIDRLLKEEVI